MVGVWENEEGNIVGVANIEHPDPTHRGFGEAFLQRHPQYTFLLGQMLDYAEATFPHPQTNALHIYIDKFDEELQGMVKERGYEKDEAQSDDDSEFVIHDLPSPVLLDGYVLQSMADENNIELRREVFGRAFNHPDPADWPSAFSYQELQRAPDYRPELDLYVVGPEGNYVACAIIWVDGRNRVASLEPVGTHPDYRGRGLGKAVVLEAIRRVATLGAEKVCVGSGQAFYEAIGFRKKYVSFPWRKRL
jgi:predicted N-acetyltransferase YhbS